MYLHISPNTYKYLARIHIITYSLQLTVCHCLLQEVGSISFHRLKKIQIIF